MRGSNKDAWVKRDWNERKIFEKEFFGESDEEIEFVPGRDPYRNLKKVRDIGKAIK